MISTPHTISDISIVIPTFNEESRIAELARHLAHHPGEVLLVDGGSSDGTVSTAVELGLRIEHCLPGRARQLNHGAACTTGKILLFLHADTSLPENFGLDIVTTLQRPDVAVGAFGLAITDSGPWLRCIASCATLRSRLFQLPYGDQGLFMTREMFLRLGTFPLLPIMEDYVFVQTAKRYGNVVTLPQKVSTSGRRWRALGVVRTTLINQLIVAGYHCGVSVDKLASLYRR